MVFVPNQYLDQVEYLCIADFTQAAIWVVFPWHSNCRFYQNNYKKCDDENEIIEAIYSFGCVIINFYLL